MKKQIIKAFAVVLLGAGVAGCGNDFLASDYHKGVDVETALKTVANVETALNGTYYRLFHYYFAGNYAINIGDVPTDISYWNTKTGHWDDTYTFTFNETDLYLQYIWDYGYKVVDNASRVIVAAKSLSQGDITTDDKARLDICLAEAHALRAYAQLIMVNVYGHQVKVNGTDFSSSLGTIVVEEPVAAFTEVSRSTVGGSYTAVLSDLNNALTYFTAAGGDREDLTYFNVASVYGLLARANLYLENWEAAAQNAQQALNTAGITTLTYGADYKGLYSTATSNTESLFALAITPTQNWSANASGNLWETYNFSPSPKLLSLYGENDCRTTIFGEGAGSTPAQPVFNGGKFAHSSGNTAYGTNYIVNAPEMFLIIAEAKLKSNNLSDAQAALLTVAKRNADIKAIADLPATTDGLLAFLKDERARELFQEGHRLWDLRRWDERAEVYATKAPAVDFVFKNYKISDLVFPIPADEVNADFGVLQNEGWINTLPGLSDGE